MIKLISLPTVLLVLVLLYGVDAIDLCEKGIESYESSYLFLVDSYASLAPAFALDTNLYAGYPARTEQDVTFPGPEHMKFKKNAKSARDCAQKCCAWSNCSMMVYETTKKSCVLVNCDDELIKSGTCAPELDSKNTNLFSAQNLDATAVANFTMASRNGTPSNSSDKGTAIDLVAAVREPERYVTIYLRMRSTLMKSYIDILRTLAAKYPIDQFAENGNNSSVVKAIEDELAKVNMSVSDTKAGSEVVLIRQCELNKDCPKHERCAYLSNRAQSGTESEPKDESTFSSSASASNSEDRHRKRRARSRGHHKSISDSEVEEMLASFENNYNNIDVDNDAGVCVCKDNYVRVNATVDFAGVCVYDPTARVTPKPKPASGVKDSNATDETIVIVEPDPALFLGLLAIDMEGAGIIYLMIVVVVGLLALLMVTWLCVLCKVRIASCLRSCCEGIGGCCNRESTVRNSRANVTATGNARRGEYRALLMNETDADAQNDQDEDISFDRMSMQPIANVDASRSRRRDNDKKK